jgi:YidC/Oxa1 family membrane protein insertase
MSHGIFSTLFYIPAYNALMFIIGRMPAHSAGLAIILLTVIIRLILFPLSKSSIRTQILMKQIEPEVAKLKEQEKDKQLQAQKLMALYKEKGINPFAGFLLLLIQFPILIGMYRVFRSTLASIDKSILYSFVASPTTVSMVFLGIDLLKKSWILAVIAVITQFIQINLALPKTKKSKESSFQNDLAHSMNLQMRFVLPLIMFPIAYISPVVALYLNTSNIFMILQELFVKRKMEAKAARA